MDRTSNEENSINDLLQQQYGTSETRKHQEDLPIQDETMT